MYKVLALLIAIACVTATHAQIAVGPSPYLQVSDSPFAAVLSSGAVEDFESGALNLAGVTVNDGMVIFPGLNTDSVDADDGSIDGSGREGHSYWNDPGSMVFEFDETILGQLPSHVGLVATHTIGPASYIFYDSAGSVLASFTFTITSSPNGETSNDRFIGVIHEGGVARIEIIGSFLELDHLQYASPPAPLDTDVDLVPNASDNCVLVPNADQRDSDADGYGNICDADVAPSPNDCAINFLDLEAIKTAFFSSPGAAAWNGDADFNGDNIINFLDLERIKTSFFGEPGPSGVLTACP